MYVCSIFQRKLEKLVPRVAWAEELTITEETRFSAGLRSSALAEFSNVKLYIFCLTVFNSGVIAFLYFLWGSEIFAGDS